LDAPRAAAATVSTRVVARAPRYPGWENATRRDADGIASPPTSDHAPTASDVDERLPF
jgi:hypothetical protein